MNQERATMAQLQELHGLVTSTLIERIRSAPSAELLGVARALLKGGGLLGRRLDAAELQQMHELWNRYVECLGAALRKDGPPAAMLSEARQFLFQNGITKDLGAAINEAAAVEALADLDLPFKH